MGNSQKKPPKIEIIHAQNKDSGEPVNAYKTNQQSTYKPIEIPKASSESSDQAAAGITFPVHDVTKSVKSLSTTTTAAELVMERCGSVQPEAYSAFTHIPFEQCVSYEPQCNAFIAAVHTAFSQHYPLVFSPDSIWLCIMQGLSTHINNNSDKLRHHFVEFEGKKMIEIKVSEPFIKGSSDNPWPHVFDMFSAGIKDHIGDKTHHILTPEFSTTGPVERAASQIVLMDCFKQFFNYQMVCICGIPSVTLLGTVDDWKLLRERALTLRQYDLDWWIDELEPVLDQFVAAASGNADKEFWVKIYKLEYDYGAELINGWILTLFPYLKEGKRNEYLSTWRNDTYLDKPKSNTGFEMFESHSTSVTTSSFASGVVSVPFVWVSETGEKYPMSFYAGFMAASQDPDTLSIHTEIGWAVADRDEIDIACKKHEEHTNNGGW